MYLIFRPPPFLDQFHFNLKKHEKCQRYKMIASRALARAECPLQCAAILFSPQQQEFAGPLTSLDCKYLAMLGLRYKGILGRPIHCVVIIHCGRCDKSLRTVTPKFGHACIWSYWLSVVYMPIVRSSLFIGAPNTRSSEFLLALPHSSISSHVAARCESRSKNSWPFMRP